METTIPPWTTHGDDGDAGFDVMVDEELQRMPEMDHKKKTERWAICVELLKITQKYLRMTLLKGFDLGLRR